MKLQISYFKQFDREPQKVNRHNLFLFWFIGYLKKKNKKTSKEMDPVHNVTVESEKIVSFVTSRTRDHVNMK